MRYADGPTVEVSLDIAAAAPAVWAAVTDIDLPARFSSEFLGGRWLDGAPCAVGTQFAGRNFHPAMGEWETICTVVDFDPGQVFAYAVGDPGLPGATWRFTLVPAGDTTRVVYWMRMGPGRSGLNFAIDAMPDKEERIVARRCEEHRANMLATLEGIRSVVEGT
ncbi:MAG TPA: SRPBCC family protein [Acidimicrobiales bacterium]|jgi:uncharacterized protein YndB with AHSA1/START domain